MFLLVYTVSFYFFFFFFSSRRRHTRSTRDWSSDVCSSDLSIFEPIWNRRYVDQVQITAGEDLGIEGRGRYYEEAGILRDMIQNHVLQLVCLSALEPPVSFDADSVRDEKIKVLRAIETFDTPEQVARNVVLGQYAPGSVAGADVPGYQQEKDVAKGSRTPTFVAIRLNIRSWRWDGVPFYIRSGKRMPKRAT